MRVAAGVAVVSFVFLAPGVGAEPLGTLCEASAARFVACPKQAGEDAAHCLLVADNEIGDRLFLYPMRADGTLGPERAIALLAEDGSAKRAKVGDIEALEVAGGVVWVVGSHGRKKWREERAAGDAKQCGVDGGRLSLLRGAWKPETAMESIRGVRVKTKKKQWPELLGASCRDELFDRHGLDGQGNELVAKACGAFAKRDAAANRDPEACASAFQIEGAVAIPSPDGPQRLWVGLRSPTLQGKAMLLRVQPGDTLRFDGIALVDLGSGRGVRDLAHADGKLWAIAAPEADAASGSFELMAIEAAALDSGALLAMRPVAALRPNAEGLAIAPDGGRIVTTTDGQAPETQGGRCKVASEFFEVSR